MRHARRAALAALLALAGCAGMDPNMLRVFKVVDTLCRLERTAAPLVLPDASDAATE